MNKKYILSLLTPFLFLFQFIEADIEEVVVTGSLIKVLEDDSSPIEVITSEEYDQLNITNVAEISKYLNISSGSRFQSNALEGVDQGMASLTLRGLEQASTLILINSKRHTFAGTPSNEGEGYIDINIVPEIALQKTEILKEGATSTYGSDAIAGVVNFITYREFDGLRVKAGRQSTSNYDQNDETIGLLYGGEFRNINYVIGHNRLERSSLSAEEIPGIAELGLSGLGKTFKLLGPDTIDSGIYAGDYPNQTTFVPDPNCESNGGILDGSFCRFLYGERFNIVNDESHKKNYINLYSNNNLVDINFTFISSNVKVNDNPQSPSYPALPFLSRSILPGEGGSPFNVPVVWYGRPLGAEYESPSSPKDIDQKHFGVTTYFDLANETEAEISITKSKHSNFHYRPDIIDSRFLAAIQGNGGPNGNEMWNIFDSSQNSQSLIDFVRGAEVSNKRANLLSLKGIFRAEIKNIKYAYGFQINNENLDIFYDEISRAEFDADGKLITTADLFFLGGGKNVSKSRNGKALFVEAETRFLEALDIRIAGRYEEMKNESSFDPKLSMKYKFNESLALRFSRGSAFSAPSMAQMFSSQINLGSVRDIDDSVFVRQASIGNPDLKPSISSNQNFGLIFQKDSYKLSVDYWEVDYEDRIEVESAQALLTQDPFGSSITRNEFGDLIGVTTTYFNEENTKISGTDFQFDYVFELNNYSPINLRVKGTIFNEFLTPQITADGLSRMINRVGKFNYDSHTHSLPKKRLNAFIDWEHKDYLFSLITRYIDGYTNERPITGLGASLGYENKVDSFLVFDISARKSINLDEGNINLGIAIINALDKSAPRLYDAPDFSFDTRVHDPRGRLVNLNLEYNF
jgi:iron complex outermembrane receptor protein